MRCLKKNVKSLQNSPDWGASVAKPSTQPCKAGISGREDPLGASTSVVIVVLFTSFTLSQPSDLLYFWSLSPWFWTKSTPVTGHINRPAYFREPHFSCLHVREKKKKKIFFSLFVGKASHTLILGRFVNKFMLLDS